jgi:magnesium-transporting ATPase (P-type)
LQKHVERSSEQEVNVIRDGYIKTIPTWELVPGDVIVIKDDWRNRRRHNSGNDSVMIMPCDAIVLTEPVSMNEAMLTGESESVTKVSNADQ